MPEFVLDSRGRKRAAVFSVVECRKLTDRIDGFERTLGLDTAPPQNEGWAGFCSLRSRIAETGRNRQPSIGPKRVPAAVGAETRQAAPKAPVDLAEACGRRMVDWDGKTTACLMSMAEFRLFTEWLEDLDDSIDLKEAQDHPEETVDLANVKREIRAGR